MTLLNMKKSTWWALAAGIWVAGCNMTTLPIVGSKRQDVRVLETSGDGFGALLAQEYRNLAILEQDYMNDPQAATHYAAKAFKAADGGVVWPDRPDQSDIDRDKAGELIRSYNMLLDALATLGTEDNASLLALAQTRYDCWLERVEENRSEDEVSICRDMAQRALGMMSVPDGQDETYTVGFVEDEAQMQDGAMQVIEQAASTWEERPYWEVVLVGHDAAHGDRESSKRLSMRRAVAVRNALAQQGIDPDTITIVSAVEPASGGPAPPAVDIRFEPVYLMKEGPVYDSLEALGDE